MIVKEHNLHITCMNNMGSQDDHLPDAPTVSSGGCKCNPVLCHVTSKSSVPKIAWDFPIIGNILNRQGVCKSEGAPNLLHVWVGYHTTSSKSFDFFQHHSLTVQTVAIGQKHSAFLTSEGRLFTYGNNQFGQLGLGHNEDQYDSPVFVSYLEDKRIVHVACGARHTAAVSCNGDLYTWGDNRSGQCALPDTELTFTAVPTLVCFPKSNSACAGSEGPIEGESRETEISLCAEYQTETVADRMRIQQVACGDFHTVAVSTEREAWAWGSALQLGLNTNAVEIQHSPRLVDFLAGRRILDLAAGECHTVALVQKLEQKTEHTTASSISTSHAIPVNKKIIDRQKSTQEGGRHKRQSKSRPYDSISDQSDYSSSSHCPLGLEISQEHELKATDSSLCMQSLVLSNSTETLGGKNADEDMVQSVKSGNNLHRTPSSDSTDLLSSVFNTADNSPSLEQAKGLETVMEYSNQCFSAEVPIHGDEIQMESQDSFANDCKNTVIHEAQHPIQSNSDICVDTEADGRLPASSKGNVVKENISELKQFVNSSHTLQSHSQVESLEPFEEDVIETTLDNLVCNSNSCDTVSNGELCVKPEIPSEETTVVKVSTTHEIRHIQGTSSVPFDAAYQSNSEVAQEVLAEKVEDGVTTCSLHDSNPSPEIDERSEQLTETPIETSQSTKSEPDITAAAGKSVMNNDSSYSIDGQLDDTVRHSVEHEKTKRSDQTGCTDRQESDVGIADKEQEVSHSVSAESNTETSANSISDTNNVADYCLNDSGVTINGVPKSRRSFLDQNEAQQFLARQLSGETGILSTETGVLYSEPGVLPTIEGAATESGSTNPLVKQVENILQYVPTSSAVQEYVTSWTHNVVTNIRTSVATTMDRFSSVSSTTTEHPLGQGVEQSLAGQAQVAVQLDSTWSTSFQRYGTLPKSTSLGFPMSQGVGGAGPHGGGGHLARRSGSVCENGQYLRRSNMGSLPSVFLQEEPHTAFRRPSPAVVLDTEVWTWGSGGSGQLGRGDTLPSLQPCKVQGLVDRRVLKVAAGANHCLALTADGQVYVWGSNQDGQLGLGTDLLECSAPTLIEGLDESVWDLAAGRSHSLLLTNARDFTTNLYFSGLQAGTSPGETEKQSRFETIPFRREHDENPNDKMCWVHSVFAGGELSACLSSSVGAQPPGSLTEGAALVKSLHELASTERVLALRLSHIQTALLKPLLANDCLTKDGTVCVVLGLLCNAFACVLDMVCVNQAEVAQVLSGRRAVGALQLVARHDHCTAKFQHYTRCFGDALCMQAFSAAAKTCSSVLDKAKKELPNLLDDGKKSRDSGAAFVALMRKPLDRPKQYCKILSKLALKFPNHCADYRLLSEASRVWQAFSRISHSDLNVAESTAQFWAAASYKLTDAVRQPSRRLLFTSRQHPVSLQGAGRFASHTFHLFNDALLHLQGASYHTLYPLQTIWVEPGASKTDAKSNCLVLTTPEEVLTLVAPTPEVKSDWLWALNSAIEHALRTQRDSGATTPAAGKAPVSLYSPAERHAVHTFTKYPALKEAKYTGMWRKGLPHGQGELVWPDGRRFTGSFKSGMQDGYGKYCVPSSTVAATQQSGATGGAVVAAGERGEEVQEGIWRNTKLHGYGYIRYANGDTYEGQFREGLREGHGVLKQGTLTSSLASMYVGRWRRNRRHGYGVHILRGEKYMGQWQDDQRHGCGIIVTIYGVYFEGNYSQNKVTGSGLLITEDLLCYEGEFSGGPVLCGKGVLTLTSGDFLDGTFYGSLSEGVKVNGTFHKQEVAPYTPSHHHRFSHEKPNTPKTYMRLAVEADQKWQELFEHCCELLGGTSSEHLPDTERAWQKCAACIEQGKKMSGAVVAKKLPRGAQNSDKIPELLETIPAHSQGRLYLEYLQQIQAYLNKAFSCVYHPLGKLLEGLVDVFRATYVGVGAHPKLLRHAVLEVRSFTVRLYRIVRILFPDLPEAGRTQIVYREGYAGTFKESYGAAQGEEEESVTVSPGALLYGWLLPRVYPPLFTLYALYNEPEDERYWRRVVLWNRQPDLALMTYLGVDQKFWLFDAKKMFDGPQQVSRIKDRSYLEAIDTLQGLSTAFSPADKLQLIQKTFDRINAAMEKQHGRVYLWSMDELFPVFQYVVVRARIQHLGAEIHFIDDLIEPHLELGELGLMFTTLKACFFQIQNEKIM